MIRMTTRYFILVLVATFLSNVGGNDLRENDCKDEVGNLCSRSPDVHDEEIEDRSQSGIDTAIGVVVSTFLVIAAVFCACLLCSCCPLYKYRTNRGKVYGPSTTQQQPYIIYTQAPYNPQQVTSQQFPQPQYNGIVYPPGQAEVHLIYPPYNCAVHEQQRDPWIVPHTGAAEEPSEYYQNSPPNQNTNTNFISR